MKFLILIFFSLSITSQIKAQLQTRDSLKLYQHHISVDDYKKIFPLYSDNSIFAYNDNNSVLKIPKLTLIYNDNVNGFNIYQSAPDNMYLAKPDSSIAFNMPVKNLFIQTEPVK